MAEYQLTAPLSERNRSKGAVETVIRNIDHVHIPNNPDNRDWLEYQKWLEDGGKPDPYVPPPEPQQDEPIR
jgi:hypothetical protein